MAEASPAEVKRYVITWGDLSAAQQFGGEYLKRRLYLVPLETEARAFALALIVSYARPFSVNRDPGKRVDLTFLENELDPEQRKVHDETCRQRKKLFAHSDSKEHRFLRQGEAGSEYLAREDVRRPPTRQEVENLLECVGVMKQKLIPFVRLAEEWTGDAV